MFTLLTQYGFPAIVFVIMLGMGLALEIRSFATLLSEPRAVLLGLAAQMLLLPAVAVGLAMALPLDPTVAVGLIILAACPGGVTSNAISLAARADIALSVSLTAISSLLVAVTLPLWAIFATTMFLGEGRSINLPFLQTATTLASLTLLPVILGMVIRRFSPGLALPLVEKFRFIAVALILFMCLATVGFNFQHLRGWAVFGESLAACLALMGVTMTAGYVLARQAALAVAQRLSIVIEVGVQNNAVALLAAITLLGDPAIARLPLVYGLLMISLPWVFIAWERRRAGVAPA